MTNQPPYIADQGMRLLMAAEPWKYLTPEAFHARRTRGDREEDPWQPVNRDLVALDRLQDEEGKHIPLRRLVITTDAELGKTVTLNWVLHRNSQPDSQTLAFRFVLGGPLPVSGGSTQLISGSGRVPADGDELITEVLTPRVCQSVTKPISDLADRVHGLLVRLRDQGRLVLLFDALDQAGSDGATIRLLQSLLGDQHWNRCRIIVSGRPYALVRYRGELFSTPQIGWRYLQVDEFTETQRRAYLGRDESGRDRYDRISKPAREILGVPRVLEYLRRLPDAERDTIRTATDVYWRAIRELFMAGLNNYSEARRLEPALMLGDWVRTRWPEPPTPYERTCPTWREFIEERVYFDPDVHRRLDDVLERDSSALLLGRGASGKSVLGVAYALVWAKEHRGDCFWLDLRELDELPDSLLREFLNRLEETGLGNSLLVIDNAHLSDAFCSRLLDKLLFARHMPKVLLLARPFKSATFGGTAGWLERMDSKTIELTPTDATLESIISLLAARTNKPVSCSNDEYTEWGIEFCGDLAAFAYAVAGALRKRRFQSADVSRHAAAGYLRERYLDVAALSRGGIETFLRFCGVTSLEIPCSDVVLGGSFSQLYPQFYREGIAAAREYADGRRWLVIHPQLSELVLYTHARDQALAPVQLRLQLLMGAAERDVAVVGRITSRLLSREQAMPELRQWVSLLQAAPGLVERSVACAPHVVAPFLLRAGIPVNWDLLASGPLHELLISSLRRTPPHFLGNLLTLSGFREAQKYIEEVLVGDEYLDVLSDSDPTSTVYFLKKIEHDHSRRLAATLLSSSRFHQCMLSAMPDGVVSFVEFVGKDAEPLLEELLRSERYLDNLRHAPPGNVLRLMKYIGPDWARAVLNRLAEAEDYISSTLFTDRMGAGFALLQFAGDGQLKKQVKQLLDQGGHERLLHLQVDGAAKCLEYVGNRLATSMADSLARDERYMPALLKAEPLFVAGFSKHLSPCTRINMNASLLASYEFYERLVTTPPGELVSFLKTTTSEQARCVVADLIKNKDYYKIVATAPPDCVVQFLEFVEPDLRTRFVTRLTHEEAYISVLEQAYVVGTVHFLRFIGAEAARELLQRLIHSDQFMSRIRRSHGIPVASFLDIVDELCPFPENGVRPSVQLLHDWWHWIRDTGPTGDFDFSSLGYLFSRVAKLDRRVLTEMIEWVYRYDTAFCTWAKAAPMRRILRFRRGLLDAKVLFRGDLWNLFKERIMTGERDPESWARG